MAAIDNYKNVLIIRLGAIGDVVRTLPAVNAWKQQYPETRFTWLVEPAAASVLQGQAALDKVFIFERNLFGGFWRSPGNLVRAPLSLTALISGLRAENFDLVVDFHGILKSAVFARLSGAPERVGFARPDAKEGSAGFYSLKFQSPGSDINRVERALALVDFLGVDVAAAAPVSYRLPVTALNRERARETLELLAGLPGKGPGVALHPGSSRKTAYKRWHQNGYGYWGP